MYILVTMYLYLYSSEPRQVSCDAGDMGCHGGYIDHAWAYLQKVAYYDFDFDYDYMRASLNDHAWAYAQKIYFFFSMIVFLSVFSCAHDDHFFSPLDSPICIFVCPVRLLAFQHLDHLRRGMVARGRSQGGPRKRCGVARVFSLAKTGFSVWQSGSGPRSGTTRSSGSQFTQLEKRSGKHKQVRRGQRFST
mmetsp:Transcript_39817/g.106270  ORF Transcript_39817/g.106270 Transcript_39817/m.106270 type:complete len:191 (+) Transcript_39817:270-842(+)